MLAKLNFLQSKYYILVVALMAIFVQPLSAEKAQSCDYRVFNIKTAEKVANIELLTQIADSCDFSIVVKDTFASTILEKELYGINVKNLSLSEIFEVLIVDNNLYYEYNKNFLKISSLDTKTFRVDYITSIRTGTSSLDASLEGNTEGDTTSTTSSTNTISSTDNFDFWTTLQAEILTILNTGSEVYVATNPIINQNAGLITVTATKQQLERVDSYLKIMQERLHKQVLIDVSILSVDLDNTKRTGIDWSKFELGFQSTSRFNNRDGSVTGEHTVTGTDQLNLIDSGLDFANNNMPIAIVNDAVFNMTGIMNFLGENGDTKVVSNPKVLALNNQQALITIGNTYNYITTTTTSSTDAGAAIAQDEEVNSIFVGILLNITPQITDDGEIILRINPSVSELIDSTIPTDIAPNTAEKKLSTVVKVKNGNTIILGGLITTTNGVDNTSVPLLSSIPLFGEAFKSSTKSQITKELIFVITPRIIGPKDNTKATLKDLGFSKRIYEQ